MPNKQQQSDQTLQHLRKISEALRSARSKSDVINYTIKTFAGFGFDRVRFYLYDKEKKCIRGERANYLPDTHFKKICLALYGENAIHSVRKLLQKKPFLNKQNPTLTKKLGDEATHTTMIMPLVVGDENILGSISLDNAIHKKPLHIKQANHILLPFVNHIALVLNRVLNEAEMKKANRELKKQITKATAELKEKNAALQYLASHDELTGLPNRRHFKQVLENEFGQASKKHPLVLAMIDLDFLKHTNDTHGHLVGDEVIAKIGKILRDSRSITYAARYAGDEFVVLLPGRHHPADLHILERLRRKILKETNQGLSIGIASYPGEEIENTIDLVRKADDALYHAKHTGRGKIVCCADAGVQVLSAEDRRRTIQRLESDGTVVTDYINQLEVINDISKQLQNASSQREINRIILHSFQKRLGFRRVRMYEVDRPNDLMVCTYATGVAKKDLPALYRRLSDKKSLSGLAAKHKKVIDSRDRRYHGLLNPLLVRMFGANRETISVPLLVNQIAFGVIVGDYEPDKKKFDKTSHKLLLSVGNHIALALQQTRLIEQIQGMNKDLETRIAHATEKLRDYSTSLEQQIADNRELRERERQAHFDIISALVVSLESKDVYTRGHSARVARYAHQLGKAVDMSSHDLTELRYGALLHDIGKLTVDAQLLNKKNRLTNDEIAQLTTHPVTGGKIIASVRFLKHAAVFVRHHHERWDGLGYPDGLKGDEIPLAARMINIADSYDAMVTRRSYGRKMTKKEAISEFKKGSGKQFDPKLASAFIRLIQKSKV